MHVSKHTHKDVSVFSMISGTHTFIKTQGQESACNVGDLGLIPELGRSPGEGKGYSSILAWGIPWTE